MLAPTLPDLSKLDREALQALLLSEHQERIATQEKLQRRETEIEHLKLLLSQLRRMQFGPKSEKLERQIEQLELRLEDLQQAQAAEQTTQSIERPSNEPSQPTTQAKPARRPLPEHLPRQTQTHVPKHSVCPDCGGELRKLSEDVSEMLEYVRACFQVIRHVRPKLSCQQCERIVQAPAPSRPIACGLAGPGLLAHVLVSKYADHLPLYRQCEIYERHGIELERSTLADWVGWNQCVVESVGGSAAALCDGSGEAARHLLGNKPSFFVVGRDRAKLGYFWRHAYRVPNSGPFLGCVVNSDTGLPVATDEGQLRRSDFKKLRLSEIINGEAEQPTRGKDRRSLYSPLWQADASKIRRIAPLDFISRSMPHWFDYALCDEAHQLAAGDTAQGNGLGTLAASAKHVAILTGTLLGGFADDVYHILFRLQPEKMVSRGYSWGESGVRVFAQDYGVLETITTIQPADNACSKARTSTQVKRRPGASPLLFGDYLMDLAAFVSLEDISGELPLFSEEVVSIPMDTPLSAGL